MGMEDREWSRSRFWLCHFLQNRHERAALAWAEPARQPARGAGALRRFLATAGRQDPDAQRWLIGQAAALCPRDPAYVQCLRLLVKEDGYHAQLLTHVRARFSIAPRRAVLANPVPGLRRLVGLRFELSVLLLGQIIDTVVYQLAADLAPDAALRGVCAQIVHDKAAHQSFHAERLTQEFADFNFVRRNLRRWRLRVMFAGALAEATARHAALLRATGWGRQRFVQTCWANFTAVLERMVPYHREALLAALLHQKDRPYDEPGVISDL